MRTWCDYVWVPKENQRAGDAQALFPQLWWESGPLQKLLAAEVFTWHSQERRDADVQIVLHKNRSVRKL